MPLSPETQNNKNGEKSSVSTQVPFNADRESAFNFIIDEFKRDRKSVV